MGKFLLSKILYRYLSYKETMDLKSVGNIQWTNNSSENIRS